MSDQNWQCKEGDPFKSQDIQTQLREYAGNPGYSHIDYADTMIEAADHIETQQQRIDALERELAEASKDVAIEPQRRVFVLPLTVAKIIDNVFLPSNPNKLRKAHPDVVAAAKIYKQSLAVVLAIDAATKEQA